MSTPYAIDAARLVRDARSKKGQNQVEFARSLKRSQGLISKYESGAVFPPGEVIMHCMNILGIFISPSPAAPVPDDWRAVHGALADLMQALRTLETQSPGNSQLLASRRMR